MRCSWLLPAMIVIAVVELNPYGIALMTRNPISFLSNQNESSWIILL
jgi:hypothetical protein